MGMGGMQAGMSSGGECLEYELRTKKVSYVVRPHKQVLLMVGEEVTIRLAISDLIVSSPGLPREVKCSVHSMVLLSEAERNERRQQQQQPVILRCYDNGQAVPCPRE
jgi:chorismate synthase